MHGGAHLHWEEDGRANACPQVVHKVLGQAPAHNNVRGVTVSVEALKAAGCSYQGPFRTYETDNMRIGAYIMVQQNLVLKQDGLNIWPTPLPSYLDLSKRSTKGDIITMLVNSGSASVKLMRKNSKARILAKTPPSGLGWASV